MIRDLSHPIESGMPTYPGDPTVSVAPALTITDDGASVHRLRCGTHTGTHIDAPAHLDSAGATLGERSIDRFVFTARKIDPTPCTSETRVCPDDLPATVPPAVDLLVLETGWDRHWGTDQYLEHPALTPAAAAHVRDLGCGLGLDTVSPDPPTAEDHPAHQRLLSADRAIIENLRGLDPLPRQFELIALPLPIDADGAPVRAIARYDPD
ncbi:MAG: cyclase family protein [Salinarchaeum sp.]